MEDTQAIACSSSHLEDSSAIGDTDGDTSLPSDISLADGSSEEAWFDDACDNDLELHNEWKLRRDKFYTDGYREGTIEGQKDSAQEGFNLGFKDSVMVGYKWGIVRGVTSALTHIPEELRKKLVEEEEVRQEFLNLHDQVDAIATDDALKLYYDKMKREKSKEQSNSVDSDPSLTHESDCVGLETYVGKLELLLKKFPLGNVDLGSNEFGVVNVGLESSSGAGVDVLMSPH